MSAKLIIDACLRRLGYHIERVETRNRFPVLRPIDVNGVEVLGDEIFQSSCRALGNRTLLDTPRLANLWMLCRMTDPAGAMAEIGTYKGGGARHLANCCPGRSIIVCDPFSSEGFENLDPAVDTRFEYGSFSDSSEASVAELLKGSNFRIIRGYFPESAKGADLPPLSFVHLDVDVYKATKAALLFLLSESRLKPRSLIVLDDFNRGALGVNKAVDEVVREVQGTLAFPLFPGQALIVPKTWSEPICSHTDSRPW